MTQVVTLERREQVAVGTFAIRLSRPEGFDFKPGQTIDLTPRDAANAGSHTFSIASAPFQEGLMIATRMRDTPYKRALGSMPSGSSFDLAGPFGSLTLHGDRKRPALLVAGGIGITPFMSMLRQADHDGREQSIALVYSNRSRKDAAFLEELDAIGRRHASFRFVPTMTAPAGDNGWPGRKGRIDAALIESVLPGIAPPIAYVAGSPAFVASMRQALNDAGVGDDDIRSEDFAGY
ncbi:MAG: FAD-dependent oxidoreductase [Steroidobacteraceae bacterium]